MRIRPHRQAIDGRSLNRPALLLEKREQLEMESAGTIRIPVYPPQEGHRCRASTGENFGLLGNTTSSSGEATVFISKQYDSPRAGQSLKVRMIFRCGFCNRGFERKRYRNEHEKIHHPDLILMDLCNEPNCGKRFCDKYSLRRHVKSASIIMYGCWKAMLLTSTDPR
jgi:hypothetical protein